MLTTEALNAFIPRSPSVTAAVTRSASARQQNLHRNGVPGELYGHVADGIRDRSKKETKFLRELHGLGNKQADWMLPYVPKFSFGAGPGSVHGGTRNDQSANWSLSARQAHPEAKLLTYTVAKCWMLQISRSRTTPKCDIIRSLEPIANDGNLPIKDI